MAAAIQQLNARVQQQEAAVTILTAERESLARQVQSLTGTTGQHVRVGVVDTANRQARLVRRRSDEVRGLVVQSEIVPLSRGSAVPARVDDDRSIVDTETQRNPRQRGKRSQHTDVLHARDDNCRSRVGQVSQRDVNERFEAWRQFAMEWEPKLRREIHVNVHHGHALCGKRNIMRVFH